MSLTFIDKKEAVTMAKDKNEFIPRACETTSIKDLTADVRHFTVKFKDGKSFNYNPGQFVQVSIFGAGEAPISITSSQVAGDGLELAIRKVGILTNAIHKLKVGDEIFIRGPYGNSFDYKAVQGKNIIFVAGGIGLIPLRSLIRTVLSEKEKYGKIRLLYGAKCPIDCVYIDEIDKWTKTDGFEALLTVDSPDQGWKGNVGVVTTLFNKFDFNPAGTAAFVCGPPIMIKFVNLTLLEKNMDPGDIVTTMEMHMKCGIGKCGHCNIGHKYCCTDGPVFTYAELKKLDVEE